MLTFEQIKELIELVSEHGLEGLKVERSGFTLKIDGKSPPPVAVAAPVAAPVFETPVAVAAAPAAPAAASAPAAAPAAPAGEPENDELPDDVHVLTSPIVGTFYRKSSPDSPPYTEVGKQVSAGDHLCIVEAMKVMNEIESDADGEIVKIFPKDGQPVEFGEPLFAIRAS